MDYFSITMVGSEAAGLATVRISMRGRRRMTANKAASLRVVASSTVHFMNIKDSVVINRV